MEIATSPEGNTYIQLSDENVKQAKSRSAEARSAFLPDIEAQAEQTTAMKSLAALGLDLATNQTLLGAENWLTGHLAPVERDLLNDIITDIPRVVGPFNSVDVRVTGHTERIRLQQYPPLPGIPRRHARRRRTIAGTPTIRSRPRWPKLI